VSTADWDKSVQVQSVSVFPGRGVGPQGRRSKGSGSIEGICLIEKINSFAVSYSRSGTFNTTGAIYRSQ
jgi:hypothetical protein